MLQEDPILKVSCLGGPAVRRRVQDLYKIWQEAEPEIPWEINYLEHLVEVPFEERNKRIRRALIQKETDLIIYHLSEGPLQKHPAVKVAAVTAQDNALDLLCVRRESKDETISETLSHIKTLASTSLRRETQMRLLVPDLKIVKAPRGFEARLAQLREGAFDATIVSSTELPLDFKAIREGVWLLPLAKENILPAVGQSVIGFATRITDPQLSQKIHDLFNDDEQELCFAVERAILQRLGQDNSSKVTAFAEVRNQRIHIRAINCAGGVDYYKKAEDDLPITADYAVDQERLAAFCDRLLGTVTFMGAGPNDADLMSVAAIRRLQNADFLVMDHEVGDHIYRWVDCGTSVIYIPPEKEDLLHDVRAKVALRRKTRNQIISRLLEMAREGKNIVRIYGDTALAVGAYEDESSALRKAQIPCDFIPTLPTYQRQRIDHAYRPLHGRTFSIVNSRLNDGLGYTMPLTKQFNKTISLESFLLQSGAQVIETPVYRAEHHASLSKEADKAMLRFLNCLHPNDESQREAIIILASQEDVNGFFASLVRVETDLRALADATFIVPNDQVARALLARGIQADYVSAGGFQELQELLEENCHDHPSILWGRMARQQAGIFEIPESLKDQYDGSLPLPLDRFSQFLAGLDACLETFVSHKWERIIYCENRFCHVVLHSTDVILFTPFEVNLLLDMLERSEITTPEEFFATHHIYAATGGVYRRLHSLNCHNAIEINLADKEEMLYMFQRATEIEDKLKSLRSE